jgi:hypothetical protein
LTSPWYAVASRPRKCKQSLDKWANAFRESGPTA